MSELQSWPLWLPVIVLLFSTLFLYVKYHSLLPPATLFATVWLVCCTLNVFFRPGYLFSSAGIWIVLLFVFCFGLGSFVSGALSRHDTCPKFGKPCDSFPFLRILTLALALIGFCAVLLIIAEHFDRVKSLGFFDGLRKIAEAENDMRFQGSRRPMPFSLLNAALYSSALFGGLLFSEQRFGSKILAMLPIIISIIYSIVTTAKAGAIQSFVMWFSAYIAGTLYLGDTRNDTSRRPELVFMACVGLLASIILLLTQSFRYGVTISAYCAIIGDSFESYILAGLPPFVSWVHNTNILSLSQDMGKWTFPGLFELAGFDKRAPGIYVDVFSLGGYSSNLYTVFRGLILDFGLPASLIMTFILGIVANRAYRSVESHKASYVGILTGLYSFLLWSPIISLFVYNAVLASAIIFAFYTVLAEFWMQGGARKD